MLALCLVVRAGGRARYPAIGRLRNIVLPCAHDALQPRMTPDQRREAIVGRGARGRRREGPGVHDGPRRGGRDGHVQRADPSLLRLDGRRAGGGVRAGRARRTSGSRPRLHGRGAATRSRRSRVFFRTYTPADKDWAFQLWLDAWAEAARRPAVQATSRRLNLEWQGLLERTIRGGRGRRVVPLCRTRPARRGGSCRCSTGWRSRSSPTGRRSRARTSSRWSTGAAEVELGLAPGALAAWPGSSPSPTAVRLMERERQ